MRLKEFATPDAQLELWKMVSDAVWAAINKQNSQRPDDMSPDPAAASRAQDAKSFAAPVPVAPKVKATAKKVASVKLPKIPTPPAKPRKPLKAKQKAKPKQVAMFRTQPPALPTSQRQQPNQAVKPFATTQQPPITKTPNFDAKTGVFPQNRRAPIAPPRRG
jgi:hypothetical protein